MKRSSLKLPLATATAALALAVAYTPSRQGFSTPLAGTWDKSVQRAGETSISTSPARSILRGIVQVEQIQVNAGNVRARTDVSGATFSGGSSSGGSVTVDLGTIKVDTKS